MNRRNFLQAAGTVAAVEPLAVAEPADESDREGWRSFVRALPAPGWSTGESGYAFSFTTGGNAADDRLPEADAYGRIVAPQAVVTVALGVEERGPSVDDLREQGHEPADWYGDRPAFVDRGKTRYRAVVPGAETALFGVGPARERLLDVLEATVRARNGETERYSERSWILRTLVDRLNAGAHLSAEVRPDGLAPGVVGAGDAIELRDEDVRVRGVAVFESAAAAGPDAVAAAATAAPLPGPSADAVAIRREGRTVLRETTVDRAAVGSRRREKHG